MLKSDKKIIFISCNSIVILQLAAFAIALALSLRSTNIHYLTIDNRSMNATVMYRDEIAYNLLKQGFNVSNRRDLPSYTINETTLEPFYRLYLKKYCAGSIKAGGGWKNSKCFDWTTDDGIDEIYNSQNTDSVTNVKVFVTPKYHHRVWYFFDRTTEPRRMITYISLSVAVCAMVTAIVTFAYMLFVWLQRDGLHLLWRVHIFLFCFGSAIASDIAAIDARHLLRRVRFIVDSEKTTTAKLGMTYSNGFYILVLVMMSVLLVSLVLSLILLLFMKQPTASSTSNDTVNERPIDEQPIDLGDLSISNDLEDSSNERSSVSESTKSDSPPAYVKQQTSSDSPETLSS